MAGKRFYSDELLAAHRFLDDFIQDNRRSTGKMEGHKQLIHQLMTCRDSIEAADIALDNNRGSAE
jgi:hypothetical protein